MVRVGIIALVMTLLCANAVAATVRGTVLLPAEPRAPDRDNHWRVENGTLPIGPRVPDPHLDVIVIIDGAAKKDASLPDAVVELHGLRMDPHVAVVPVGGTVEFKNSDRVPHTLYLENGSRMMPATPTPSGQSRKQKFFAAGEYHVRDEEFPHVDGTVLVVQTPFYARLDDKGVFKIDLPEGKYTLKVYWHDKWALSQPLEVGAKMTDVTVQVPAPPAAGAPGAKP
jgi:plastocyanin